MSREVNTNDLESALRSLSPAPARLDRDRLLFEAGRAAAVQETVRATRRGWALAAAAVLVSLGVGWTGGTRWGGGSPMIAGNGEPPRTMEPPQAIKPLEAPTSPPSDPPRTVPPRTTPSRSVPPSSIPSGDDYLRLRNAVASLGPDAWLPPAASTGLADSAPPPTFGSMRQRLARGEF